MTSNQDNMNRNPTGKGGFGERPEDINRSGTWNPRMTFSFQYRRFMNMTVEEFKSWKDLTADKDKTMVEELAYVAVLKARSDIRDRQEITDRTEGKAPQTVVVDGGFFSKDKLKVEVVDEQRNTTETE
ncbi:MAG TPA: hypothetical protein PKL88_03210 [bacterium]|nr:hypothetical protein [bacterium]